MTHSTVVEEPHTPTIPSPYPHPNAKLAPETSMPTQMSPSFFDIVYRFRLVALTSPLWLGAVMILLNNYGSEKVRATIQFLASSPLR
jgi:hypothetical protein